MKVVVLLSMQGIKDFFKIILDILSKILNPKVGPAMPVIEVKSNSVPTFNTSLTMPTHGKNLKGFPEGLVVHFTAGRSLKGDKDIENSIKWGISQGYAFWGISNTGTIYKTHELDYWGYHAGSSAWKGYGTVSDNFLGVEIACAGKVEKINDNKFKSWFGEYYTADQVRYILDPKWGEKGYYHKYTEEQENSLIQLCVWLYKQNPQVFKIENICGHNEVAIPLGRKNDPCGSLSMPMSDFRELIKTLV